MNVLLRLAYAGATTAARLAVAVAPDSERKLWRGLAGRRGLHERLERWSAAQRDPSRPLLWMHAPSVGEGLQARVVLERLRAERPDVQIAFTYFSPSATGFATSVPADVREYLPIDATRSVRRALEALRPNALVFSKLDVWPTLAAEAKARGVRLGLISGTVAQASSRLRAPAKALLREAYAALDIAGAIAADDAERLVTLGVRQPGIRVTGDTRYDQAWARARASDLSSPFLVRLASSRPTLVAGSTWPSDERRLLHAWLEVRRALPGARIIIAPHEPTEPHLTPIESWAAQHGISLRRLSQLGDSITPDVLLVDRVGVLGDLYALATCAYVGGGFHSAGLHSLLEPAAFGAPVVVGPRHAESADAQVLLSLGAAVSCDDAQAMAAQLLRWLSDRPERDRAGQRASRVVEGGLGAADRSLALVLELLGT
ncbi:MAG: 3-deoxy-D-manno-octulosonic acid transferase [Gemmatimonadaceae bacterium]